MKTNNKDIVNEKYDRILSDFHDKVQKLHSNRNFYKNVSLQLNYSENEGLTVKSAGPDEQSTKAFILDFRHFIAENSSINFYSVCNFVFQNCKNEEIIKELVGCRENWGKILEKKDNFPLGGMRLKVNNQNLKTEEIVDLWFNAEFFHIDERKRKILQDLQRTPMGQFTYFVFIDCLQRLGLLLFYFDRKIINGLMRKSK